MTQRVSIGAHALHYQNLHDLDDSKELSSRRFHPTRQNPEPVPLIIAMRRGRFATCLKLTEGVQREMICAAMSSEVMTGAGEVTTHEISDVVIGDTRVKSPFTLTTRRNGDAFDCDGPFLLLETITGTTPEAAIEAYLRRAAAKLQSYKSRDTVDGFSQIAHAKLDQYLTTNVVWSAQIGY